MVWENPQAGTCGEPALPWATGVATIGVGLVSMESVV